MKDLDKLFEHTPKEDGLTANHEGNKLEGAPSDADDSASAPADLKEDKADEIFVKPCPPNHLCILDPVDFHLKTKPITGSIRHSDTQIRLRNLLLQHKHLAQPYPLQGYPSDMAQRWQRLRTDFPNFSEVLGLLEKRYALASLRQDTPVSFPPILLLGDPGVGKTAFCTALAKAIGLYYGAIPLAGLTEAFTISGLDIGWSSGNPGRVFEHVSAAGHANPLLLLDEVDKCGRGGTGGDPHAPLHILLERHSAKRFEDIAIRMHADMSWINWIATANMPEGIPGSLLSRFRMVEVPKPSREQMRAVIRSIYANKRENIPNGDLFMQRLDDHVVTSLQDITPRAAGLAIEEAMGAAAQRPKQRRRLRIVPDDLVAPVVTVKKGIGFCP